ncbi:sensor histidine kinase [Flavihumibacter profundi]|uniref:sensor histidine kinase n=1 Tax=Flavihumibacter profundi TaxID=2716883 RepID=UPI001CC5AC70|nr:ATP-binding protein [Flavihumibacter profundi]MBZ5858309.1 PAS domain-containing protein [Flavihumibacter profundi]
MRTRTKYILFVSILHLTALLLTYFIFNGNKLLFLAAEVVILVSAGLSYQFFKQLVRPLMMLSQGAEAMKDRDFTVKLVPSGNYEVDQLIYIYNQMMDELRTERTRHEQQHLFLEKLIQTSPTGIIILDFDDNVQQVNPKALELLEMEPSAILLKSIQELSHPVLDQVKLLDSGKSITHTFNGAVTYKLQKSHFVDRGFPRHFIMIEELTAEILAAEKKAYGKVIRMMAHEVNNSIGPVNSILASALSVRKIWSLPEHHALAHALQVAIDRNHNLNLFMRNFADLVRLPAPNKTCIDMNAMIIAVVQLMERKAVEKSIRFNYCSNGESFHLVADSQQMEQALINIVKNAMEAIEADGVISIELNRTTRILIISDNGKGISTEVSEQLFSPFFSTKRDGQGIGLTLVKEILMNHGFEFSLKQAETGLTVFTIRF